MTVRAPSVLIAILMLCAAAVEGAPHRQAMGGMQGGCGDYSADLHLEMKLMSGRLTSVTASREATRPPRIRPGAAYSVHLLPQEQVHFMLPPGQNRNGAGRSAGMLSLRDLPAGNWRISTDNPVWIDVVASGRIVNSSSFEMKMGCTTILKTVVYALRDKTPLLIQVNGATQQSVRLLVTPVAAPAK